LWHATQLFLIRENHLGNNPVLDRKKILARNLNNLRLACERRAEHLAARHFFLAALLRRRRLTAVTMCSRHRRLRLGHDHLRMALSRARLIAPPSINPKSETFKCFYLPRALFIFLLAPGDIANKINRMKNYAKTLFSILAAAVCTVAFAADKPDCKKTGKNCPMNDNKECNCGKSCDCGT
jgi:hypothetical protein